MTEVDITSKTMDGMGPHGVKVGLLRVLGPAHVWALVRPYGLAPKDDETPDSAKIRAP